MSDNMIKLGDKEYPIAQLTLGQMKKVGPCFSRMGIDTVEGMDAQLTIIFHGMKAANPELKMEDVDALKGVTFEQIREAVAKVGVMAGLEITTKTVNVGEVAPVDEPAV